MKMTEEEVWDSFQYDSRSWVREYIPQQGEVTYRYLVAEFLRKFPRERNEEPTARTAIMRAVRRLERQGKLTLVYYECDPHTIETVRRAV